MSWNSPSTAWPISAMTSTCRSATGSTSTEQLVGCGSTAMHCTSSTSQLTEGLQLPGEPRPPGTGLRPARRCQGNGRRTGLANRQRVRVLNTLRAVLPGLRAQRSGHVLNIGSVGGFATAPGFRTDLLNSSSMRVEPASLADYVADAGPVREELAQNDGRQPGDPVKAAKAIVDITEVAEPPLRLQPGADAVERVEAKLDLVRREVDEWRHHAALATGM